MWSAVIFGWLVALDAASFGEGPAMSEIVVIGAGLSGCLLTIALHQQGLPVTLVDRYATYPADFRAEQIVGSQIDAFRRFGVLDKMVAGISPIPEAQAYTGSRTLPPVVTPHYGLSYQCMVQAVRDQLPKDVPLIVARATDVETGWHPVVHLDNGQTLPAALVVMATGLNTILTKRLGVTHQPLSKQPTITIGFDIAAPEFRIGGRPILVYCGNKLRDKIDYLTIFPCETTPGVPRLRGNLFLFRDPEDPWVRRLRQDPQRTLMNVFPNLRDELGAFTVDHLQCRVSELAVVANHRRDGLVFIGDAYQTPCPAAGTGIDRLMTDVQRLTDHVVRWFRTGDFSATSLASFYQDPIKRQMDAKAIHDATFRRGIAANPALIWSWHRAKVRIRHYAEWIACSTRQRFGQPATEAPMRLPPVARGAFAIAAACQQGARADGGVPLNQRQDA